MYSENFKKGKKIQKRKLLREKSKNKKKKSGKRKGLDNKKFKIRS